MLRFTPDEHLDFLKLRVRIARSHLADAKSSRNCPDAFDHLIKAEREIARAQDHAKAIPSDPSRGSLRVRKTTEEIETFKKSFVNSCLAQPSLFGFEATRARRRKRRRR